VDAALDLQVSAVGSIYIRRLSQGVPDGKPLSVVCRVPEATSVVKMKMMMFGSRNRDIPKEMECLTSVNRLYHFRTVVCCE